MKTAICPKCNKQFTFARPRVFCDRKCAASVSAEVRGTPIWEPEAVLYLESLAGSYPLPYVVKKFNSKAKREGWHQRTQTAIEVKFKRIGCSCKTFLDNFSAIELARTLQIKRDRVERWIELGLLPYKKVSRNLGAIKVCDFRQFARTHWQELASTNLEALEWLGVDPKTMERVAALPPLTVGLPVPVKRLDTGETFRSVKEASRRCYIDRTGIMLSIKQKRPVSGVQWEAIA